MAAERRWKRDRRREGRRGMNEIETDETSEVGGGDRLVRGRERTWEGAGPGGQVWGPRLMIPGGDDGTYCVNGKGRDNQGTSLAAGSSHFRFYNLHCWSRMASPPLRLLDCLRSAHTHARTCSALALDVRAAPAPSSQGLAIVRRRKSRARFTS